MNKLTQEEKDFIKENEYYFTTNNKPLSAFWFKLFEIGNRLKGKQEWKDIGCGRCLHSVKEFVWAQYLKD